MATSLFLVQLLFIGTLLIIPAYTKKERCNLLLNATASNFTVVVTPKAYKANTTYLVTISDNTNSKNVTEYLLQALSPQNNSVGKWNVVDSVSCHSINTAIVNATQKAANWTSPHSGISSMEIRVYTIFTDQSAKFKTVTLKKEPETTTAPATTTPNSVSMVHSSSFFIAIIQLPLLLVTSKLLS